MSILGKKWVIRNENKDINLIAKLLQNRGIDSAEKVESFFDATLSDLHDPALMKEMDKAVDRIKKAIEKKEKIMEFHNIYNILFYRILLLRADLYIR